MRRPSLQMFYLPRKRPTGWKLLFDGKTTSGWRGFRKSDFPSECWAVADGILKRVKQVDKSRDECGDIVTAQQYDNFEFQLEWKIEPGGNSGIKYLVLEDRPAELGAGLSGLSSSEPQEIREDRAAGETETRKVEVHVDELRAAAH